MLQVYAYRSDQELEKHDYFLILITLSKNLFSMGFNIFRVKYFLIYFHNRLEIRYWHVQPQFQIDSKIPNINLLQVIDLFPCIFHFCSLSPKAPLGKINELCDGSCAKFAIKLAKHRNGPFKWRFSFAFHTISIGRILVTLCNLNLFFFPCFLSRI